MKRIILIVIYIFILYSIPFIATDLVFNFTNTPQLTLGLFHVSGIVLCILIERNKDYFLK
jgi:hypothetical protein